jgi:hypothetical protein
MWQPAGSLNVKHRKSNASPIVTTTYFVQITDTVCNYTSVLSSVFSTSSSYKSSKYNDIDCSNAYSQLNAMGGVRYSWTPTATLNNPNISNSLAGPITTTEYKVKD